MITTTEFENLIESNSISTVRVVSVPFEENWSIDVNVHRTNSDVSKTEKLATRIGRNTVDISRFGSLDRVAAYLHSVGIKSFIVDQNEAVESVELPKSVTRILESTARVADLGLVE